MNQKIDFEEIFNNLKEYFSNLKDLELYSWIAIAIGIIMIIVSIIIW